MTNDFEDRIRELTRPINGQMPRPWMTRMTNPRKAEVFVIGMNQSRKYPEDQICHQRHMDALFNRNGQSCRGIYDEVTGGKASHTRRNTDRLVDLLKEEGINNILETDVICYSTRKMSDLREAAHAGGEKRGKYIFRYLLEQICPPVLIVHGVGAGKELAATLGIGLLGAGLAPGFELFLLAGAVFGFGLGMLDGPTNALAVDIAGASSARILNMIHSAFGLGAVAGPLLSALVYSQTGDWRPMYIGLAIACLAAAVPFAFVTMPARVARQPGAWRFSKVINPHIVVIMAVMFCAVGVEMIYQSWLPSYLELDRGVERTIAAASLTLVSVGLIAGRILMAVAASRWDNYKVLTIAFGLCAIAAAGVMLPIGPIAALAFIGLASMFVAGGFPMAIAIGTRQAQGSIGAATGLIVAAAGIGGLIIPPGSGLLVERDRFDLVMQLPVAIALLGAVCVLYAGSISRRDRQIAI